MIHLPARAHQSMETLSLPSLAQRTNPFTNIKDTTNQHYHQEANQPPTSIHLSSIVPSEVSPSDSLLSSSTRQPIWTTPILSPISPYPYTVARSCQPSSDLSHPSPSSVPSDPILPHRTLLLLEMLSHLKPPLSNLLIYITRHLPLPNHLPLLFKQLLHHPKTHTFQFTPPIPSSYN